MTTIDNDDLMTVAGGVTMGPNGEGCIRLPRPFPQPQPRPVPGLPGSQLPLGKQAGGGMRW